MLTPEELNDIPKELEEYFINLENEIIKDIAKRLSVAKFDSITTTKQWRINKARQLGVSYDELTSKIADYLKVSDKKVKKVLTEAAYKGIQRDLDISNISFNADMMKEAELASMLTRGIKQTNGELHNFTKTMAKESTGILEKALDNAYLQVRSGAFDYNTAIKNAVEEIGKHGIQCVNYNGHKDHVDVAVRRAVLSGTNKTVGDMQLHTAKQYGLNYAHVTQHVGARPEHALWQGKVYWIHEKVEGMENFYKATLYGKGEGLCGWNCRHNFYVLNHADSSLLPLDNVENERVYELTQKQRYYERTIRYWKRRLAAKQGAGLDDSKERAKVCEWNKKLKTLVENNPELKRQWDRESIGKQKKAVNEKIVNQIETKNVDKNLLKELDDKTILEIDKAIEKIYNEYPSLRNTISSVVLKNDGIADIEMSISNEGISVGLSISKSLNIENAKILTDKMYKSYKWTKKLGIEGIIRHEMGHLFNYMYYVNKHGLKLNFPYDDATLIKFRDDLLKNEFATEIRNEVFLRMGIANTDKNVATYFSNYAIQKSRIENSEFFAEAFSDASDTKAKAIFDEVFDERRKQ